MRTRSHRVCLAAIVGALALVGACGAGEPAASSVVGTVTAAAESSPATTSSTAAATTAPPPVATSVPASSTTTDPATPSTVGDATMQSLPPTFLAITDDLVAVEVATGTGEIVREIGHRSQPADIEAAGDEGATYNVVDAVYRTRDGSAIAVVECCEPAAGLIHVLGPDQSIDSAVNGDTTTIFGWNLAPAPQGDLVAVTGYDLVILSAADVDNPLYQLSELDTYLGTWATGTPAWGPSGDIVFWLGDGTDGYFLHSVDLSAEEPIESSVPLAWVEPDEVIHGLAAQSSGNLVAFATTRDAATGEPIETRGVVMAPAGDLIAAFPVETGSTLGSYDPTGAYLIYVDGDGTVRWQGVGQSGELASGYVFAAW